MHSMHSLNYVMQGHSGVETEMDINQSELQLIFTSVRLAPLQPMYILPTLAAWVS